MNRTIIYLLIFLFQLVIIPAESEQGKLVYLISTPRSCSTVCMRMMEASGEFVVLNEPAIYPFVLGNEADRKLTEGWFSRPSYTTFDEMKSHILQLTEHSNVFVKEICFFVEHFLSTDEEFVANPNIQFVFLIRDPHDAIISYYNKFQRIVPNFTHFIGCKSSYSIYEQIKDKVKNPIIVISAEDLCNNSRETTVRLFAELSIPYHPECLHWQDLGDEFTGSQRWNEIKVQEQLHHWHDHAIHSTQFEPIKQNAKDAKGNPTFEEISNELDRLECQKMYEENLPFYKLLKNPLCDLCLDFRIFVTTEPTEPTERVYSNERVNKK